MRELNIYNQHNRSAAHVTKLKIKHNTTLIWCRERGLNPRPSDVSDTTMGLFARHTIAL